MRVSLNLLGSNVLRWDQKVVAMIEVKGNPQFRRMKIKRRAEESVGFFAGIRNAAQT